MILFKPTTHQSNVIILHALLRYANTQNGSGLSNVCYRYMIKVKKHDDIKLTSRIMKYWLIPEKNKEKNKIFFILSATPIG